MKICTKCGEEFPATVGFFSTDTRTKDGLKCWCINCLRKNSLERYHKKMKDPKYREMIKKRNGNRMKDPKVRESVCKYNREYKNNRYKNDAVYREGAKQRARQWEKDNKEVCNERGREWRKNNKESYSKSRCRWRKNNTGKINAATARRRALKLDQTPVLTPDEKRQIIDIYKKSHELGSDWQVDHKIPLSKGGLHCPDNLQVVLKSYNQQKSDKFNFRLPFVWEISK